MRGQQGAVRDLCVDTDKILTAGDCAMLVREGVKGVFRYLSDLTLAEIATITSAGLVLYFVNHSRLPGWIPSAQLGAQDGARDVAELRKLGIPQGVHVFFDLEGVGGGSQQATIAHVNAWGATVKAAGYIPALYVGEGALLTSVQLYALEVYLYWHSCSNVEDIGGVQAAPACGWAVYQVFPDDIDLNGVLVDYDWIQQDFRRRLPVGIAA